MKWRYFLFILCFDGKIETLMCLRLILVIDGVLHQFIDLFRIAFFFLVFAYILEEKSWDLAAQQTPKNARRATIHSLEMERTTCWGCMINLSHALAVISAWFRIPVDVVLCYNPLLQKLLS
ncbi:uncharacterized protein LOC104899781 isoform X2 [Beta vulgaris subsp. vulgaris]|uniref:uncharacterized protein LOC104899781 isoform X2 n=1 Tax=Beta vulgaris subsp. vulgaris TaxID=3555 RepID=UPI0025471515|nr:uncharacterized protein LOC104899781 isoform X2 [Beta vulgaris subsp. vulgaris]